VDVRSDRFPLVDALRATAALAILLYHLAPATGVIGVPVLRDLAFQLQAGIALFFLISAFLLYRPFVRARVRGEPVPFVRAYAWRRVLRLVPAYWAALTVLAVLFKPEIFTGGKAVLFYGFAQVYDSSIGLGGLAAAWSLCVEAAFYVMLPLYALGMRRLSASTTRSRVAIEAAGLAVLFVAGLGFRLWALRGGLQVLGSPLITLPTFLDWFALGMGLALLSVWNQERDRPLAGVSFVDRHPGALSAFGLLAFAGSAVAARVLPGGGTAENLAVHVLHGAFALGLLAPAVLGDPARGSVRRVMSAPVLAWLGVVSYGIFLWQGPVIRFADDLTPLGGHESVLWLVLVIPAVVAVAAASWYGLERPALSLKRLVGKRAERGEPVPVRD
jgi:peptidoglycan/LPS O-acetylase OafA/YrhL